MRENTYDEILVGGVFRSTGETVGEIADGAIAVKFVSFG